MKNQAIFSYQLNRFHSLNIYYEFKLQMLAKYCKIVLIKLQTFIDYDEKSNF